jgi:hypothetical protein
MSRIKDLEEALAPFANFNLTPQLEQQADDFPFYSIEVKIGDMREITVGDFRRARRAMDAAEMVKRVIGGEIK